MEFIEHTIAWCKGEILQGRVIFVLGLLLLVATFLFYKMGSTPFAKGIVLPLLVFSTVLLTLAYALNSSNQKRIVEYSSSFEKNSKQFIEDEKLRVENFSKWYVYTRIAMTILIFLGIAFYFYGGVTLQSIALVLMLVGFSTFALDHFSEERANTYYEKILEYKERYIK